MAKKNSNKKLIFIFVTVFVLLLGGGYIGKQQGWIGNKKAKKVVFGTAELVTIVEKVSASGKVEPVEEVTISPQVAGEITEIFIEEGDSVVQGQLLLKLNPDNLLSSLDRTIATLNTQKANYAQSKARLAQSKAQYEAAKRDFDRNEKLFNQKAISQQDYDNVFATFESGKADYEAAEQSVEAALYTVKSAEASVKEARENLGYTEIYAPMGGIVTKLLVEKGERVVGTQQMQGTEMLRIANLNQMEVRVNVNENDIIRVTKGDTAIIDVDAYSYMGVEFKGIVSAIANSANESATAGVGDQVTEFEVKILISDEAYKELMNNDKIEAAITPTTSPFRPGMTASVDIITEEKKNILGVALSAVTTREDKKSNVNEERPGQNTSNTAKKEDKIKEVVFRVVADSVEMVEVQTGISDFDHIQITSGLAEGDQIVTGPYIQVSKMLNGGDPVETMEENKKSE
ncbi:efflux RND transporter periplasmic adaptor subunit [Chondrinema litorale]|uniref:efflux RND transporter periplasmic adaptor subunit n=1 Tax=Chondrinema litorale TaxID=2994555 RepID=UPI002543B8CF|nr:efflux RND transporter periplasmic adaptor subunit [Chondrinema litorale]UZR94146.1 efflux RND transporter periplasmic adaptor subunit [Chondrinema litorale]